MALTGERDADGSGGFGVFLRVIEQNFDHLPELCRVAGDGQIGGDVGLKRQLLLEEQGLEGERGIGDKLAEVDRRVGRGLLALIDAGEVQKAFDQAAHLMRHGENVGGELRLGLRRVVRAFEQLGICHDDGQRRFQFVRGIGNELLLLLPRGFDRLNGPASEQQAHAEEQQKRGSAEQETVAEQGVERGLLACGVDEDEALPVLQQIAAVAEVVLRDLALHVGGGIGDGNQLLQEIFVREVVITAVGGENLAVFVDLEHAVGEVDAVRCLVEPGELEGTGGERVHHVAALFHEALPREMVDQADHAPEQERQQRHDDGDELDAKPFQHTSATSRW